MKKNPIKNLGRYAHASKAKAPKPPKVSGTKSIARKIKDSYGRG
jgi:hypothetical protein